MKTASKLGLMIIGLTLATSGFAAKDPLKNAIKARQGEMQLRAFNAGPLFAMAKGQMDYDADMASKLAGNLKLMLDLDTSRHWPKGSDVDNYMGETTALPKIWTTYPEIGKYGKKYAAAVNEVAAVAGNGADALKSKIGALGDSCKGCHDEFREKKN
ncbi:MAG: cytochrome c [Gammaproteobacteria bacterium]|nr:cytochrome c [Gammaproteobacteria bacterium]MDH3449274.1 cytochrome c [Gammaproteobacteria bacterium]